VSFVVVVVRGGSVCGSCGDDDDGHHNIGIGVGWLVVIVGTQCAAPARKWW
jgi:hypothetical protein